MALSLQLLEFFMNNIGTVDKGNLISIKYNDGITRSNIH